MVVLEGGGMLSSSGNQYLQPDYLSPLPTTLDAKKSPLALLAQTCSQIGADSPPSKPLMASLEKPKKNESTRCSPASVRDKSEKNVQRSTPIEHKLAFKPYENNVVSKKSDDGRPNSKPTSVIGIEERKETQTSDRKTVSPTNSSSTPAPETGKTSPSVTEKSLSPTGRGASPIIRYGLDVIQGHSKDGQLNAYKSSSLTPSLSAGLNGHLSSLCCPPGLEHTNPAFRPPFPGAPFSHHHAAMLAAGYAGATPGPYLSYARVKTPSGGEALVPVCKDPYCTGCQFSMHNQQMLMGGGATPCPSGCTQCDHQKYNLAMAMSMVPPGAVPSSLAYSQLGRPFVCSWIAGDNYCGKRFVTSEELLQHLRTHTSGSEIITSTANSTASLLNSHLFSTAALHRSGYPNPPLSPLSAARYHPYGKPTLPTTLAASPYSAFNPTALGPYYSPYSVYGQRLGAAAVHP